MYPVLFKIGPITIYTYGLFVFLGVICGYLVSRAEARRNGIDDDSFSDICFWMAIAAFLGAKLLYILIEWKYFLRNPLGLIRSGFVFYGGLILAIVALYFLAKKYKLPFLKLLDIVAIGLPLGQALGRLGCFFYGCCYGKVSAVFGLKRIPTQLISALALIIIFFILFLVKKRKRFNGQIFLFYILSYGLFRFVIEFFRADPRGQIGFFSTSQFIAVFSVLIGIFLLCRFKDRHLE